MGYDDYDAWGYILPGRSLATGTSTVAGAAKNKFTGKEWDDELGLKSYHFPARPYDPEIGRWLSPDPIGEEFPSWSPYSYVFDSPLVLVDPFGTSADSAGNSQKALAPTPNPVLLFFRATGQALVTAAEAGVAVLALGVVAATPGEAGEQPIGKQGEDVDQDGLDDSKDLVDNRSDVDSDEDDFIRIRHYTNRKGLEGIEKSGVIMPGDKFTVFAESARKKPLAPRVAEAKYLLKPGHGRDYVETDVLSKRVSRVKNPKTKNYELRIVGPVQLRNPVFVRRK